MRLIVVFLFLSFYSCQQQIDTSKNISINGIEINRSLLEKIEWKAGKKFQPRKEIKWVKDETSKSGFSKTDSIVSGIEIPFVKEKLARKVVRENLTEFQQAGYYIYLKNLDFDKEYSNSYYDVAVIKCKDQFELVKLVGTSGVNYEVTNEEIIKKLKLWYRESPFVIIVADEDRIEANFSKLPADLSKFAKDVYSFCPDVIDQGAGSEQKLIEYFRNEKAFWLWWD